MKTLVAFYSRTGTTRKVAENLAGKLGADVEDIIDTADRSGIIGYIKSGKDALQKKLADIKPTDKNPEDYEMVIIGTPNWASKMAPAIRTYISNNKSKIKKAAFFCTQGGSGDVKLFDEMVVFSGIHPVARMTILTREVPKNNFQEKLDKFISQLRN